MKKFLMLLPVILLGIVIALGYTIYSRSGGDIALILPGVFPQVAVTEEEDDTKGAYKAPGPGEYDSKDTAVVSSIDTDSGLITFLNLTINRFYTLSYDGLTTFYNKNGRSLSILQLRPGDIVDVAFRRGNKLLVSAMENSDSWNRQVKGGFELNKTKNEISFGTERYLLSKRPVILSGEDEISLEHLNVNDTLRLCGVSDTVYSISVENGHGYLRLTGDEYFVDGFIEVGNRLFTQIKDNMLLTLPEGDYRISVRNGRHGGTKETTIYRGEETLLDVSDLKGEDIRTGNVFFTLDPTEASVYIDGKKVDTDTAVVLEYGIHSMIVTAKGYDTISHYLRVGQENANLNITMERKVSDPTLKETNNEGITEPKGEEGDGLLRDENGNLIINDPANSFNPTENAIYDALPLLPGGESLSGVVTNNSNSNGTGDITSVILDGLGLNKNSNSNQATPNLSPPGLPTYDPTAPSAVNTVTAGDTNNQVVLSAPVGAEVYVDGSYIGTVPVSFAKNPGSRIISLRKTGYQTRNYTIQVDTDSKDMQLSFSELVPAR